MPQFIKNLWKKWWCRISCKPLPDTVWEDPRFLEQLERKALEDQVMTQYEEGISTG